MTTTPIRRGGKKLVLAAHPSARIERRKQNFGPAYYLVRIHDDGPKKCRPRFMYSGEGDTPAQAWNDAADRLGLFDKEKP